MLWGAPFQTVHLVTLAIAAAMIVGFYFLLKYLPERARFALMLVLSLSGIVAMIYNLVAWAGADFVQHRRYGHCGDVLRTRCRGRDWRLLLTGAPDCQFVYRLFHRRHRDCGAPPGRKG